MKATSPKSPKKPKKPTTLMTDKEIQDGSDSVMHPELASVDVNFLGKTFAMRPLPISYAKKVNKICQPMMHKFAAASLLAEKDPEKAMQETDLDNESIDALLQSAQVLLDFYDLKSLAATMEDNASVSSLYGFVTAQLGLNESNDFLLRSCRMLLNFVKAQVLQERTVTDQLLSP